MKLERNTLLVLVLALLVPAFSQASAGPTSELEKLKEEYPRVLDQIVFAKMNSDELDSAFLNFRIWNQRADAYPELSLLSAEAKMKVFEAWEAAVQLAGAKCFDDFTQLEVLRAWTVWPKNKPELTSDVFLGVDQAIKAINACAKHFKAGFESAFTIYYNEGVYELTTLSEFPLQAEVDTETGVIHLSGQGPLDYSRLNVPGSDENCKVYASGVPGTLIVNDARLEFEFTTPEGQAPRRGLRPGLRLVEGSFQILNPSEKLMISCPEGHYEQTYTHWVSFWKSMHTGTDFQVTDWELTTEETFARKEYHQFVNGQFKEETKIRLEHHQLK